jgi:hypothetical protein
MIKNVVAGVSAAICIAASAGAQAQSNPRYVQFQPSATKGALYAPDSGTPSNVAFLTIHRTSNFMNMIGTRELSKRGFFVLGMNPRSDNNEAIVHFENVALDIKQGVEFLRKQPGVTKVVLIGFSGGGPATTFYQAVAEKGVSYCQGPNKLTQCPDTLKDLPKADGMLLLDAHPGNSVNGLRSLNPAVLDEDDPSKVDASLDPFDAKNGFNANGYSTYTPEFLDRYFKAQAARMNRLIDKAVALRADVAAGKAKTTDDAPFIVYRERRHDLDRDGALRARAADAECEARPYARQRNHVPHGRKFPQRERHPGERFHGRHRLVHEQQFDALRGARDHGPDADRRHGRALFHRRQRNPLRPGGQQGQGLCGDRRRRARADALRGLHQNHRPVLPQRDQEPLRLRRQMGVRRSVQVSLRADEIFSAGDGRKGLDIRAHTPT